MTSYIHIGYWKTGSTSIQGFLTGTEPSDRHPVFARTGRSIVERGVENHSEFPWAMLESVGHKPPPWITASRQIRGNTSVATMLRELSDELDRSPQGLVLSAEPFPRVSFKPKLRNYVRALSDVLGTDSKVICYLQRPDRHLNSWYNQRIKEGTQKLPRLSENIDGFVRSQHVNYFRALEPWFSEFDGRVEVVDFADIDGSVVEDFCNRIDWSALYQPQRDHVENQRIPNYLVELLRRQQYVNLGDGSHNRLKALLQSIHFPPDQEVFGADVDFLGMDARKRLADSFESTNRKLGMLTGRPGGFFDDIDNIVTDGESMIGDVAAFEFVWPAVAAQLAAEDFSSRYVRQRQRLERGVGRRLARWRM